MGIGYGDPSSDIQQAQIKVAQLNENIKNIYFN